MFDIGCFFLFFHVMMAFVCQLDLYLQCIYVYKVQVIQNVVTIWLNSVYFMPLLTRKHSIAILFFFLRWNWASFGYFQSETILLISWKKRNVQNEKNLNSFWVINGIPIDTKCLFIDFSLNFLFFSFEIGLSWFPTMIKECWFNVRTALY